MQPSCCPKAYLIHHFHSSVPPCLPVLPAFCGAFKVEGIWGPSADSTARTGQEKSSNPPTLPPLRPSFHINLILAQSHFSTGPTLLISWLLEFNTCLTHAPFLNDRLCPSQPPIRASTQVSCLPDTTAHTELCLPLRLPPYSPSLSGDFDFTLLQDSGQAKRTACSQVQLV